MTALYVLADEYRATADRLADMDLDAQTIADTLESISGDIEAKAANVAMFVRNLDATASAIRVAESDMAARRKAIEKRAADVRAYLLRCMKSSGMTKISCPYFSLSVRANPESVEVFDADQIPFEFMRHPIPPPPEPDKIKIKAALKSKQEVPGAKLVAGERLDIK